MQGIMTVTGVTILQSFLPFTLSGFPLYWKTRNCVIYLSKSQKNIDFAPWLKHIPLSWNWSVSLSNMYSETCDLIKLKISIRYCAMNPTVPSYSSNLWFNPYWTGRIYMSIPGYGTGRTYMSLCCNIMVASL